MARPLPAISAYCLWCQGGHEEPWEMNDGSVAPPHRPYKAVEACASTACGLHALRGGQKGTQGSVLTSIRNHCFSCLAGYGDSIKLGARTYTRARPTRLISRCQRRDCQLYPFRYGKRD